MDRKVGLYVIIVYALALAGVSSAGEIRAPSKPDDCPSIGAIRWDAWHGKDGEPGKAVERTLGPEHWHVRLPFCGRATTRKSVEIECDSPDAMDQELLYAKQAGIDYWAFVTYPPNDPMSKGLKLYLASRHRESVRFSLIVQSGRLGNRGNYQGELRRLVKLMEERTYKKVANGRPLFFLGFVTENLIEKAWGSRTSFKNALDEFRAMSITAGIGNPYIVILDFDPKRAKSLLDDLGLDAISSYATHAGGEGAPYSDLASHDRQYWDTSRATGASVVPIVMAGWDRRPRVENPVPWESQRPRSLNSKSEMQKFYAQPKPTELAAHLADAIYWVRKHPDSTPANTVLVYAWNENDEGGWLVPTLSEGTARVDALGSAWRRLCTH